MLSVGTVALLVNLLVLFVVVVADRVLGHAVLNFATSRFINTGSAPVVHETDTWLFSLPTSVVKYRKHPGASTVPHHLSWPFYFPQLTLFPFAQPYFAPLSSQAFFSVASFSRNLAFRIQLLVSLKNVMVLLYRPAI